MLVRDCKDVIKIGDMVRTNGDADMASETYLTGRVTRKQSDTFILTLEGGSEWSISYENEEARIEIIPPEPPKKMRRLLVPSAKGLLKKGDFVRTNASTDQLYERWLEGKVKSTDSYGFTIVRKDNGTHWSVYWENTSGAEVEIVDTRPARDPSLPPVEKKKVNIEIYRKDGKTFFKFDIDERFEKRYAEMAETQRESVNWKGLKFYYIPSITADKMYIESLRRYRLFDDFGSGLMRDGLLNIAWLRTVGGKGEIQIKELVSFAELSTLFRNATSFIREHFENTFKDFSIKGTLSVEV